MPSRVSGDVARYGWLSDTSLAEAGCVTVVVAAERDATAAGFGLGLESLVDDETAGQLAQLGAATVSLPRAAAGSPAWILVEDNGFEGSRDDVLEAVSKGGKAASIFWNVNGLVVFSCARRGKVVYSAEFAYDENDSLPASLRPYVELAQDESVETDLVAVGAATPAPGEHWPRRASPTCRPWHRW